MIFDKLWEKSGNTVILDQYTRVLKRPKILKKMKNFHPCNMFFKHLINIQMIALFIEKSSQKSIDQITACIAISDLFRAIAQI